jgi:molybdopterin-guanine dinucleotide biosynthesis protein A
VTSTSPIAGIILAGGLATRMGGGDKPLIEVAGRPMLDHVVEHLRGQVARLAINANGDPARFAGYGLPVVADPVEGNAGPLAGILAGMRWAAREVPDARFLASVAGDTPFFPRDLVARLGEGCGRDEGTVALAASAAGVHPVFGLWPVALADDLEAFLEAGESRKILAFADRYLRLNVPFDSLVVDGEEIDPFFNVNTPEDAKAADAIARGLARSGNG